MIYFCRLLIQQKTFKVTLIIVDMDYGRELPGMVLPDEPTMHLYAGYMTSHYRIRTYVPTTIFDSLVAVIKVYQLDGISKQSPDEPELVVAVENVQLRHLPIWDIEGQCITLHSKDERAVLKATKKLERMLEEE